MLLCWLLLLVLDGRIALYTANPAMATSTTIMADHNAADDGLLLTLLGCLLGPCLLCGLLGRSALSACGTLGLTLRI